MHPPAFASRCNLARTSCFFQLSRGAGIEVNKVLPEQFPEQPQDTLHSLQIAVNDLPPRTMTFQDSYVAMKPSTSKDKAPRGDPQPLIGYQKDPQLKERQQQQQHAESHAAKTPVDLRTILSTNKKARKQANANRTPNPFRTQQPEARRVRLGRKLLSSSDAEQLDITARDAVRLQHEIPVIAEKNHHNLLRFEVTSRGDREKERTLEKATIGAHYLRLVKRVVFQPDRYPPWFERLRANLQKADSPYIKPLPRTSN